MNVKLDAPPDGFVTAAWVKRHFSISNSTLYAWCASGVLPPMYRVGPRAMRFRADEIARFEEERTTRGVKPR